MSCCHKFARPPGHPFTCGVWGSSFLPWFWCGQGRPAVIRPLWFGKRVARARVAGYTVGQSVRFRGSPAGLHTKTVANSQSPPILECVCVCVSVSLESVCLAFHSRVESLCISKSCLESLHFRVLKSIVSLAKQPSQSQSRQLLLFALSKARAKDWSKSVGLSSMR